MKINKSISLTVEALLFLFLFVLGIIIESKPHDVYNITGVFLIAFSLGLFTSIVIKVVSISLEARALQKAFKKDCEVAGILKEKPSIHFHSLRHGFCTHAIEKGIDITRVQVLAGHSNIATTSVYTHLNPKIAIDDFRRLF